MNNETEEENGEEAEVESTESENDSANVDDFSFDFGSELNAGQEPMDLDMPIVDMPIVDMPLEDMPIVNMPKNQFDLGLTF